MGKLTGELWVKNVTSKPHYAYVFAQITRLTFNDGRVISILDPVACVCTAHGDIRSVQLSEKDTFLNFAEERRQVNLPHKAEAEYLH